MNQEYIEYYTNSTLETINRIITLNSQMVSYMGNLNTHVSSMNYINYLSNNNQHNQNIQHNQTNENNQNNQNNQTNENNQNNQNIQTNENNQNIQNNQNNNTRVHEFNNNDEMNYYNNLFHTYKNFSTNNISNIIETCLDYNIYNNQNGEHEENICPITKEQYKNGEKIGRIKKCSHSFNYDNIHKWLSTDLSCPLCRHRLIDESNYIEVINNDENLILTREQFLNLMKDFYNIDARVLLRTISTPIHI